MVDPMEHERMRFKSMTMPQLYTRLNRIKDPAKLQRFIIVAGERFYFNLQMDAKKRLNESLFNPDKLTTIQAMQNPIKSKNVKVTSQTKTKVETPVVVLRRHLEF